ncbi:P-loop containing nucleoside triphosphate hydrolase protein [Nemania abortiva]|nr:P-loop containing nucleoside triphosphate hydrolase protein [Nemania abortiva]
MPTMGPHDREDKSLVCVGNMAYDEKLNNNRQHSAAGKLYKTPETSQNRTATDYTSERIVATTPAASKESKAKPIKRIKSQKRKTKRDFNAGNEVKPNKRQKRGSRKLNARKAELQNQFENIFDWTLRQQGLPPGALEYTPDQRKRDETQLEEAILLFKSKIKREGQEQDCPNDLFRVEGMTSTIRDYQTVGAGFMLRLERVRNGHLGGIVADEMGIGKTLQAIACIKAHPPSKKADSNRRGSTLIIVPNQALIKQWAEELERHGGISKKEICKYTGRGKMGARGITGYLYLLASYSQVERDFKLHSSEKEDDEGPLFEVEFYRIILDEGDNIKNYNGSTSKACAKLKGKLKWVLSGTPLRNSVKECLPYFRFLGIDVNENLEQFVNKWGVPKSDEEYDRTMQILATRMIRREGVQFFLGREVCKLPDFEIKDKVLSISEEEEAVSRHLQLAMIRAEREAKEAKESGIVESDPDEPKSNFNVRCIRLRQAADHPLLLEECINKFMEPEEVKALAAELEEIKARKEKIKRETTSSDGHQGLHGNKPSIYDLAVDIKSLLDDVLASYGADGCVKCSSKAELQSLECGHTVCRPCYRDCIDDASAENKKQCKCPQPRCGKTIALLSKIKEEPDEKGLLRKERAKPRSEILQTADGRCLSVIPYGEVNKSRPGDDYNRAQPKSGSLWLSKCDKLGSITPSTKTNAAIEIIKEWQEEAPDDKIVIFTEWIKTAQVLGRMLDEANVNFVYYDSEIPQKTRDRNLLDFKTNPHIKVIVAGMKAANVGLNLTVANRMIIMNPWWNHAAEAQAFGRVKRHGQTKKTYLVRLFADGTIDERIRQLQLDKMEEIKAAMIEGRKPKLLTPKERYWLLTGGPAPESPFAESDEESTGGDDSDSEDSSYHPS